MRKVILYIAMSLDGYIARKDGSIDWLESDREVTEDDNSYNLLMERIDTVILGRTTYDQVRYELSPDIYFYEDKISYILTSRIEDGNEKLHFVGGNVVDLINKLKNEPGKDIWVIGGVSVITPLIEQNLIDEFEVAVIPIILGDGIRLFETIPHEVRLHLNKSHSINQLTYLSYSLKK